MATTPREQPSSRDHVPQAEQPDRKTGSGSLVDSSVSEEYANRSWAQRGSATGRQVQATRHNDGLLSQQRSSSNAGLHAMPGTGQGFVGFGSRTSTINMSQGVAPQARPRFASAFESKGDLSSRTPEHPPFNVYTKFDRPIDPSQRKPDSANGYSSTTPSPNDERRPPFSAQYNRTASMSNSRDGSLPPSRGADEPPNFTQPDYSKSSQRITPSGSRAPSISSMRNGPYNPYFNVDQIAPDVQQLNLNGDSRFGSTYRAVNGFQGPSPAMTRFPVQSASGHYRRLEDMDELEHASLQYLELDDRTSTQSRNTLSTNSLAGKYFNAGGLREFQPGQPYIGSSASSRNPDFISGTGSTHEHHPYHSANQAVNQRLTATPDALSYMQPSLHQLMLAQTRSPYAGLYSPYAMQLHSQLMQLMPLNTTGLEESTTPRDSPLGGSETLQSALMYEFKSNTKTKRYELKDIFQHIAEFSGDQHGSRFIQTKLETANSEEKEMVFREIEPNALPLMTDVFGNYVIQKFFEHGDQIHKKQLANQMRGQVLNLSLQMYGCRVVQKALDTVLVDQQKQLVRELENHVLKCVKDQNGNHVIQKAIERCPAETIDFIISAFQGQVQHLSIHPYGCRVIQRCLEKSDLPSKYMIMTELMQGVQTMISDQFGNYVVQHIVAHDEGESRQQVLSIVAHGLEGYSKHKFASNVVEKCLEKADDAWRQHVVYQLIDANARRKEGEGVLVGMIKDNFGNYVIRKCTPLSKQSPIADLVSEKLLDTLKPNDYNLFLESLHPAMVQAKRTGCGKQTVSIEKKMHRYDVYRHGGISNAPQFQGRYSHGFQLPVQMPMAMAPFASHYNSAATTPPPLTADTQSVQSSCLPSLNGDAVEGATASRKGSDPASLQGFDGVHR